ncbi:CsbD family protein [Methylobacterium haplocladii]|uniref:CsbD-like domain-containing protein n=1 Tax=Methylobacterium haplocladii TaxID=1176176 RepID=A0A512IQL4_9HYPH|nr:CsbD family protein [Methylobacterium haplocladii]GEP00015.1 hypothetical protein MHA02_24020 [Methylobacterium haplocladii]GJD85731.1 hypothetical protein HPGCJGGD_3622 [Methylobacterium haplocladii]GLS59883.1 hypothetical protein GCM10007887_25560 [Methylobacterium haplocladii]
MSDQSAKTSTEQLKGSVKDAIGKLTGDIRVQAEGKAQKQSPKFDGKPGTAHRS